MSEAESSSGLIGEAPRYVCRSPGCLGSSLATESATWLGGGPRQQNGGTPEVLGAARPEQPYAAPSPSISSTTWLGSPSYAPEPPRRSAVRERAPSQSTNGHEFEDGVCLHCGRMERLAGRYGWSCPVRLP
ncbi:MAG TPA: hypothetical protein VGV85_07840 [Longimicrobiaceae bacterium]|nr:hypothetical protein [Longimicrobiaceae bacterium]